MYTEFYGLNELPFALTPDPRYLYFTPSHTEVMANLHYGIESGRGLIVVTGEVGTGKTTLLRWMMQRLDRTVMVAYIFNPRLSVPEFYQYLATLFDIQNWENKSELLMELGKVLDSRHSRGLRTVLVVDEAHGLSTEVLEEIRLLCNFESDTAKHLQIVLTGQPELRDVLNYTHLRQLKQRVALRCEINALPNVDETAHYIASRLKVAGARNPDMFSPGATDYIFRCSGGIPRNINNLCDNAMLNGFASGEQIISRAMIEEVAATFDMLPRKDREHASEDSVRIFNAAGRAELWAAGNGKESGNGNGGTGVPPTNHAQDTRATFGRSEPPENFSLISPAPAPELDLNERLRNEPVSIEELGSAFNRSGFGRGNNGQSL
ncbi:MAG TPA: AAA family ATPase [Pyrinomonadaceae bacterium]|nr:AAA family ATPase [Pyrinomonadaceae bacterium]